MRRIVDDLLWVYWLLTFVNEEGPEESSGVFTLASGI
jgi:hypothetical protein